MPVGGESKVVQLESSCPQAAFDNSSPAHVRTMVAPRANDLESRGSAARNRFVIPSTVRVRHLLECLGVRASPAEQVAYREAAEAHGTRPSFAPSDRRIVPDFRRRGRVQHNEENPFPVRMPDPGQLVAVSFARGVRRDAVRIIRSMGLANRHITHLEDFRRAPAFAP